MKTSENREVKVLSADNLSNLRPGLELSVQISNPGHVRFNSMLLGFSLDNFMLISLPPVIRKKYQSTLLFNGNHVVVRFLLEGKVGQVIAFTTTIESCITFPHEILFLHFPEHINSVELRKYPRVPTCLRGKLKSLSVAGSKYMIGRVRNVSLGGCCFIFDLADYPVNIKKRQVEVVLGSSHDVVFLGDVKNQRLINDMVHVGIEFQNEADENEQRLMNLHIDSISLRHDIE